MKKIKVVWLCHFANSEIKQIFQNNTIRDFAPWINDMIKLIQCRTELELHIIAPNYFNNKNVNFSLNDVCYHFFRYKPFYLTYRTKDLSFNYRTATKNTLKAFKKINPDIIHLHGSENPVYAITILPLIRKVPVLLTIQGFVYLSNTPQNLIRRYIRWNRIRIENLINTSANYITAATEDVNKVLNDKEIITNVYPFHYPTTVPLVSSFDFKDKKFDVVFSARITKDKGIEDLIYALKIIKENRPNIKAIIIGGGSLSYINEVKKIIVDCNLENNIIFAGFQETQQDMFRLAAKAEVSVLPTYFDGLPGSIREAMFMKLPVVAYSVGGIPMLNKDKECITLVERHNIQQLAEKILLVLDNHDRTKRLVQNAYELITEKYDNNKIYENLLNIYKTVLKAEKGNEKK